MSLLVSDDYLVNHAYRNVWCSPKQDKQGNFELARITKENGVFSSFSYQWRTIALPVKRKRFHVYQIGQIHPSLAGLYNNTEGWVPITMAMENESNYIHIYNGRGRVVPRCLCWYLVTGDKNLILAVQVSEQSENLTDIDLEREPLFARIYTNAYYRSNESNEAVRIKALSKRIGAVADILGIQAEIAKWPGDGATTAFVNGKYVDGVSPINVRIGDYVDVVYDASVKFVIEFDVSQLREFNSEKDLMRKYLLVHDNATSTIDYIDDIDLYLVNNNINREGTYIHKNDSRTMRQVTHSDWSVAVPRIDGAKRANAHLTGKDVTLIAFVRKAGFNRDLVFENSRIFELYKLPLEERIEAMLGTHAYVDVWRAEKLENTAYVEIMGAPAGGVTKEMVQDAYGYNALSVLLGNTPDRPSSIGGNRAAFVPEGLRGNATAYEYDKEGKLVHYEPITVDNTYGIRNKDTSLVEMVFGVASLTIDLQTTAVGEFDPRFNYRFYIADAINGIRVGEWADVTGTPSYFTSNGKYSFVQQTNKVYRVVSNKKILGYNTKIGQIDGVIEFDILHKVNEQLIPLDVPLGQLVIFMNGYSLIENLDYVITGSRVTILNKKHLRYAKDGEQFTVRYMGLAQSDMSRVQPDEVSFVYNDMLSTNNRYDVRQDRVLRIVVDGCLKHRDDLKFAEHGIIPSISNIKNGAPYQIGDIIVPINSYLVNTLDTIDPTYELREKSRVIDKEISNYLTMRMPQEPLPEINAIPTRYPLYSPFLSRIISDLIAGYLWDDRFVEHFGDEVVRDICEPYLPLLTKDPASGNFFVDKRYVIVHPHADAQYKSMGMYQWRMLQRIRDIYTPDVDLSSHVSVLQF